jgi:ADP-ribose pyrophosphatase YjhB (NUDIX family)
MEINFCMNCGHALETRRMDEVERRACPVCPFVHWGNYSIGVGALILREGKVLLVRRAQDPGKGYWTNPGGYIEQLESIEHSIEREVLEETGIIAKVKGIVALRDQPRGIHNVYIAFKMDYVSGEPQEDGHEVDSVDFYSYEEAQTMNVAPFTRWLLHVGFHAKCEGLLKEEQPVYPTDSYYRM